MLYVCMCVHLMDYIWYAYTTLIHVYIQLLPQHIKCLTKNILFYRDYFNRSKDDKDLVVSDQMSGHYQVTKLTAAQDEYEEEITTFGYAVAGIKNVIKLQQ